MKSDIVLILFFSSACTSFTIHKQEGDINFSNSTLHENTNNYFSQESQNTKKQIEEKNYQERKTKTEDGSGANYGFINYGKMSNSQQSFGYSSPKNYYGMNRRSTDSNEDGGKNEMHNSRELYDIKRPKARSIEETTDNFQQNEEASRPSVDVSNEDVTQDLTNEIVTDIIHITDEEIITTTKATNLELDDLRNHFRKSKPIKKSGGK